MKIAILGYGTVGKGVVKILEERFPHFEIVKIVVRLKTECIDERFTTDFYEIFNNDVDVLMEMIVGDSPTYEYIHYALSKCVHVITSNKATVACHLEEYMKLAKENHCQFRYEASVAGGIPWIQGLIKAKRIDKIERIEGILNGTTNYILDHMLKENKDYNEVLQVAQKLGYAESDPSADVDGMDALRKICISSSLGYNIRVNTDEIDCFGISNVKLNDVKKFKEDGMLIKLMGYSNFENNKFYACVEPVLVSIMSKYASVDENNNAVSLYGNTIGELMFIGQGAGQAPTANAMIQDLLDINDRRYDQECNFVDCEINREDVFNNYIFCMNEDNSKIFSDKMDFIEKVHERYYITCKPSTVEEKNKWIKELSELNCEFFYARRRVL